MEQAGQGLSTCSPAAGPSVPRVGGTALSMPVSQPCGGLCCGGIWSGCCRVPAAGSGAGPQFLLHGCPLPASRPLALGDPPRVPGGFVPVSHAVSSLSLYSLCLFLLCDFDQPATLSPVWVLTSLHALAACDQAQLSVRLPSRGPWGTPLPRWPPRPSRITAFPGGHPSQGPRQQPAVVGAAPGDLSGAVPWLPGSTKPHAPRPKGKKDGGPPGVGVLL